MIADETPLPLAGREAGDGLGRVVVLTSPRRTRLVLSGELDVSLNEQLVRAVDQAIDLALLVDIDVRDVTFMDSSVVAMLARLAYRLPHRPRVIEPPDVVRFLLKVTGVEEAVDVVDHDPGFPEAVPVTPPA